MRTETFMLPTHWASALINEDYSGLDEREARTLDAFLSDNPNLMCIDCSGDPEFRHFHDAMGYGVLPCDCAEFTFQVV